MPEREKMASPSEDFFASIGVNREILSPLHSGIAIFDARAKLMFANATYKKCIT